MTNKPQALDEQMIEDVKAWVVLPCMDRTGKHVSSWDICSNQPEPDAIGVGVVASVYSGEATARAILAAVQTHSLLEEALKPFSQKADAIESRDKVWGRTRSPDGYTVAVRLGDCRKARAALAPEPTDYCGIIQPSHPERHE